MEVSVDNDIKEIARMIIEVNEMAYNAYKPLVDDICARQVSESEVEHLLDYMVGICKYLYLYPEMITSEIYTYKEMYEDDDSTGAN